MPNLERVMERMPIFAKVGIKKVVNGAISHTPDSNPLVGPAAGVPNFWLATGTGIGIAQGPGCGKYLAQWMVHGSAEINMLGLDPRRFGAFADQAYASAKAHREYWDMYRLIPPGEERPEGRPAKATPLYDKLKAKGCVFTEGFGWERPKWFSLDGREEECSFRHNNVFEVVAAECRAVRERVGVFELPSFAKFEVSGPGAEAFLDRLCANRMSRRDGGIVLAHALDGPRPDPHRVHDHAPRARPLLPALGRLRPPSRPRPAALLEARRRGGHDRRRDRGLRRPDPGRPALAGGAGEADDGRPRQRGLPVAAPPGRSTSPGSPCAPCASTTSASWAGSSTFRWPRVVALYDAVWAAGEEFGIADFGLYAMNSLRMEKAYAGWGAELTNEITPVEAGLDRFVKLDHDFVGRAAVVAAKERGVATHLVYLEVAATDSDAAGGEPVFAGGKAIGVTTSGGYGHATGKSLAFAYVDPGFETPGTKLEVELIGDRCPAIVLAAPVYDPENAAPASVMPGGPMFDRPISTRASGPPAARSPTGFVSRPPRRGRRQHRR